MDTIKSKASASERHPAVVQGQEDLTGVKSVEIKRSLKKNSDSEYVVNQSVRTEMLYNSVDEAKQAYREIDDAKEEVEFDEPTDSEKEVKQEEITPMTEEEKHAASFNFGVSKQAEPGDLGIGGISERKNPGQINFDIGGQNPKALDSFTHNNGSTTAPEHQEVSGLPYAFKESKTSALDSGQHFALIEPDFPVSDMEHELTLGVNREMEHTSRPDQALEIAIDHLAENPKYYTLLNQVMPEHGVEEKTPRDVEVKPEKQEDYTPAELADKHDYIKSYTDYMQEMLNNDK